MKKKDEYVTKMKSELDCLNANLDNLKNAGEDAWENGVAEMEKIGDAFRHSYNYFKSQF